MVLISIIMIGTAILVGKLLKSVGKRIEKIDTDLKKYIHEQKEKTGS